jgi:hypothetical protein
MSVVSVDYPRHLSLARLPITRVHDRWIGGYGRAAVDPRGWLE